MTHQVVVRALAAVLQQQRRLYERMQQVAGHRAQLMLLVLAGGGAAALGVWQSDELRYAARARRDRLVQFAGDPQRDLSRAEARWHDQADLVRHVPARREQRAEARLLGTRRDDGNRLPVRRWRTLQVVETRAIRLLPVAPD